MKKREETASALAHKIAEQLEPADARSEETLEPAPAATLDMLEGLDMDAFWHGDETDAPPRWKITDDGCADWALRKIADERAELARIEKLASEEIERIEEKLAAAQRRCENGTRFLTDRLAEYFETVPHKSTKTRATYRLLHGSLVMKLGGQKMKQNDEALLEFLKASGRDDMIQITERPRWGEYKKRLQIQGDSVVDKETGEIVEGVEIVTDPDVFAVQVETIAGSDV